MQHRTTRLLLSICCLLASCAGSSSTKLKQFPATFSASYPNTIWLTTMEQKIAPDKNAVYASLPLAWLSIAQQLGKKIQVDEKSHALKQLAQTTADRNSVDGKQFRSTLRQEKNTIFLQAALDVNLRFDPYFEHLSYDMKFDGVPVHTFGMTENSFDRLRDQIEIHRYRDDDHFVIGLLPTDRKQQILLYKTDKKYETMQAMYIDLQQEIQHGRADMTMPDRLWRYSWTPLDHVAIPRIKLGTQAEYNELVGSVLHRDKQRLIVGGVQQNIAFLLNETGSKLATEAETMMDMGTVVNGEIEPKHFSLDSPFYLIVRKREDHVAPYLILWISNTELLEIQE